MHSNYSDVPSRGVTLRNPNSLELTVSLQRAYQACKNLSPSVTYQCTEKVVVVSVIGHLRKVLQCTVNERPQVSVWNCSGSRVSELENITCLEHYADTLIQSGGIQNTNRRHP